MTASDEDMIRRGDALALARAQGLLSVEEIRAIPAVQVAVKTLKWAHKVKMPSGNLEVRTQNDGRMEFFTHCGIYTIRDRGTNGSPMYMLRRLGAPIMGSAVISELYTAAQADYEARIRSALTAQTSPDVAALVEALEALIQQTYDCEKELTEVLHHIDFCGESEPLAKARAALARVKGVM